jgi:hypothetical protein
LEASICRWCCCDAIDDFFRVEVFPTATLSDLIVGEQREWKATNNGWRPTPGRCWRRENEES